MQWGLFKKKKTQTILMCTSLTELWEPTPLMQNTVYVYGIVIIKGFHK